MKLKFWYYYYSSRDWLNEQWSNFELLVAGQQQVVTSRGLYFFFVRLRFQFLVRVAKSAGPRLCFLWTTTPNNDTRPLNLVHHL